jgi:hypothetical protein
MKTAMPSLGSVICMVSWTVKLLMVGAMGGCEKTLSYWRELLVAIVL